MINKYLIISYNAHFSKKITLVNDLLAYTHKFIIIKYFLGYIYIYIHIYTQFIFLIYKYKH